MQMRNAVLVGAVLGSACASGAAPYSIVEKAVQPGDALFALPLWPAQLPVGNTGFAYTLSMPAGTNLWKVPLPAEPAAPVCLDFSEPVFYVRAAPASSAHRNDWVIFIPGGGSVQSLDGALTGWFEGAHGEMSSRWAPPSIGPGGILDPLDVRNPFAEFNMVFIHKCSYDRFMGRRLSYAETTRTNRAIAGVIPGGSSMEVGVMLAAGTTVKLAFRGHDIVDGVIDALADSTVDYDDGNGPVTMPSLADADTVLFIGHSGGSRGATMIVDEVAARIHGSAPSADVRLVMDAGFDPGAESVVNGATYPATSYPTFDPANGGAPLDTAADLLSGFTSIWNADGDATCLANEANDAVCGDVFHVLMNWVETPMFVRQDLADVGHNTGKNAAGDDVADCWQTPWDTDPDTCYGDTFAQAGAVLDQIDDLALMRSQALTHTVLGTTLKPPSGFFPACGYHNGAQTDAGFYSTLTTTLGLSGSYATTLWLWYLHPNLPIRPVEGTPPAVIPTACPPL